MVIKGTFLFIQSSLFKGLLLMVVLLLTACFRQDVRTASFVIEEMATPDDLRSILLSLREIDGIVAQPEADFTNRTLHVEFNGRVTAMKNIEEAIARAGYALPNRPLPRQNEDSREP